MAGRKFRSKKEEAKGGAEVEKKVSPSVAPSVQRTVSEATYEDLLRKYREECTTVKSLRLTLTRERDNYTNLLDENAGLLREIVDKDAEIVELKTSNGVMEAELCASRTRVSDASTRVKEMVSEVTRKEREWREDKTGTTKAMNTIRGQINDLVIMLTGLKAQDEMEKKNADKEKSPRNSRNE